MQFTFIDMAGKTLFIRDDAERALWTQEEMSLDLEFPRVDSKIISIGQRVFFIDPSTGSHQIYEIKQAKTLEPDHYQSIVAENICISELSDEHMDNSNAENKTASAALQGVLSGTQWQVGTVSVNPVSSGNFSRGSVWQAVLQITENWNVYIVPRVTLSANGSIARYLDIMSTDGVSNGLRLSIDKNLLDPSVTYDDSDVVTALFGYGGTISATAAGETDREVTFAEVVWSKTSAHPAKPYGQKYLEDPAATQAYGRNGRGRFGFYQNTDITDPQLLLQKTWESLQVYSKPSISIEGTVADLYRLGYADQPIKLHDIALVEVNPVGFKSQIQIIRMTVDLLDASATTLTIGSYIPNIVYIENKNNNTATGSRGGGGGGSNKSTQTQRSEYETEMLRNNREILLRAYQNDLDDLDSEVKVQDAKITVNANKITQEVIDRREADNVLSASITVEANRITSEVTRATGAESTLSGRITTEADRISLVVSGTGANAKIKAAQIVSSINEAGSSVLISANHIRLDGNTTVAGMLGVENGGLKVKGQAFIQGNLTTGEGTTIFGTNYRVGGSVYFSGSTPGSSYTLTGSDVAAMLVSASVDGNVLTIKDHSGNEVTFSKATSLSDGWSGNTYTVTATQNGVTVGSKSVSPNVQPVSSQGSNYVDLYVATGTSSAPGYETHGNAKKLYLVQSGLRVDLKSEDSTATGSVYAQTTIPNATVTGAWSGGTWTATSNHGGSASVSPYVNAITSQGGVYVDLYVATSTSTSPYYENHGTVKKLYLVRNINATTKNGNVELRSENSTSSGTVYAQMPVTSIGIYDTDSNIVTSQSITGSIDLWGGVKLNNEWIWGSKVTIKNAYTSSMSIKQQSGYAGSRYMVMYYKDNLGDYHAAASGSSMYWYFSATDLNNTASYKTMHY